MFFHVVASNGSRSRIAIHTIIGYGEIGEGLVAIQFEAGSQTMEIKTAETIESIDERFSQVMRFMGEDNDRPI